MPASNKSALSEARTTTDKQLKKYKAARAKLDSTEEAIKKIRFVRSDALKKLQAIENKVSKEDRAHIHSVIATLEEWERQNTDKLTVTKKTLGRQAANYQSLHTETKKLTDRLVQNFSDAERKPVAAAGGAQRSSSVDMLYSGLMWSPFCSVNE